MDEKQLGKMLLEHSDTRAMTDPVALARQILDRDRARVRRLGECAFALWLLAVCLGGWATWYFVQENVGDVVRDVQWALEDIVAAGSLVLKPNDLDNIKDLEDSYERDVRDSTFGIVGLSLAFLLAGGLSLLYVRSSRNATLRQINASLMEISEQLRRLNDPGGTSRS